MKRKVVKLGAGQMVPLYSMAFSVDLKSCSKLVVISGQVSLDEQGQLVGKGDFLAQCSQVYANLMRTLEAAGAGPANIVSFRTFLTRAEDFPKFHEWRRGHYPSLFPNGEHPPNTAVVVSALVHPDMLLEVEAIAAI